MERKIGEIFELGGEWYQCVESDSCGECSLFTTECGSGTKSDLADKVFGQCSKVRRTDNKSVIFKKLEKVGEPIVFEEKLLQRIKTPLNIGCGQCSVINKNGCCLLLYDDKCQSNELYVEVKQNNKNMEEKKTNFIEKLEALCKKYNMSEGVCVDFISEVKEIIKDKEECNFKPFDLEEAKEGKPICTRDGRKARIICFDFRISDGICMIAAIECCGKTETIFYYDLDGKCRGEGNNKYDLMMLPEKKEGWVNVYKGGKLDVNYIYPTKETAITNIFTSMESNYIDTIKVEWEE